MPNIVDFQNSVFLVKEIADRMRNPEYVRKTVLDPHNCNLNPSFIKPYWGELSIAGGYPGVLLLHAELDRLFPDEKWDTAIHAYMLAIKNSIESTGIHSLSMFGGLTGICFAIQQASKNGTHYKKLLHTLNSFLANHLEQTYFFPLRENLKIQRPNQLSFYDLIEGISGIGLYLLRNFETLSFSSLLEEIISLEIALTRSIEVEGKEVPGWYLPNEYQLNAHDKLKYPKGNFNSGLAHGVSGILSFLSLALYHGFIVDGHIEAIQRIIQWLKKHRNHEDGIFFWNSHLLFEEEIAKTQFKPSFFSRQAWCYGLPGITRSLFLAGIALKDDAIKEYALSSFCSMFEKEHQEWGLPGPTICHGISGLLLITSLMARDTQSQMLQEKVKFLEKILLDFFNFDNPFGFRDKDPTQDNKFVDIDQAGLLEGASGVLLTLLSIHSQSSYWHLPLSIDF